MATRTRSDLAWNIASYAVMVLLAIICIFPRGLAGRAK